MDHADDVRQFRVVRISKSIHTRLSLLHLSTSTAGVLVVVLLRLLLDDADTNELLSLDE